MNAWAELAEGSGKCRNLQSSSSCRGLLCEETRYGLFDQAAGIGKSGLDRSAELLAESHCACGDGEQECVFRQGIVEFASEGEKFSGSLMMGGEALPRGGWVDGL